MSLQHVETFPLLVHFFPFLHLPRKKSTYFSRFSGNTITVEQFLTYWQYFNNPYTFHIGKSPFQKFNNFQIPDKYVYTAKYQDLHKLRPAYLFLDNSLLQSFDNQQKLCTRGASFITLYIFGLRLMCPLTF